MKNHFLIVKYIILNMCTILLTFTPFWYFWYSHRPSTWSRPLGLLSSSFFRGWVGEIRGCNCYTCIYAKWSLFFVRSKWLHTLSSHLYLYVLNVSNANWKGKHILLWKTRQKTIPRGLFPISTISRNVRCILLEYSISLICVNCFLAAFASCQIYTHYMSDTVGKPVQGHIV